MNEVERICAMTEQRPGMSEVAYRETIVRCRDCRHYSELPDIGGMCSLRLFRYTTEPQGFCWKGERR